MAASFGCMVLGKTEVIRLMKPKEEMPYMKVNSRSRQDPSTVDRLFLNRPPTKQVTMMAIEMAPTWAA